jgi:hypothetical protein
LISKLFNLTISQFSSGEFTLKREVWAFGYEPFIHRNEGGMGRRIKYEYGNCLTLVWKEPGKDEERR